MLDEILVLLAFDDAITEDKTLSPLPGEGPIITYWRSHMPAVIATIGSRGSVAGIHALILKLRACDKAFVEFSPEPPDQYQRVAAVANWISIVSRADLHREEMTFAAELLAFWAIE